MFEGDEPKPRSCGAMADRASVSDWERPVVVGETTGPAVRGRPQAWGTHPG